MQSKANPTPGVRPGAKSDTNVAADMLLLKPQSMRASLCRKGHVLGLVPVKLPNGKLLWDTADIERLLSGDVLTGGSFPNCRAVKDGKNPLVEAVSVAVVKGDHNG